MLKELMLELKNGSSMLYTGLKNPTELAVKETGVPKRTGPEGVGVLIDTPGLETVIVCDAVALAPSESLTVIVSECVPMSSLLGVQ